MCDKDHVRKIFQDRARVVVYLEQGDVEAMLAQSRFCGMTLVEWMREVLRGELLEGGTHVGRIDTPRRLTKEYRELDARDAVGVLATDVTASGRKPCAKCGLLYCKHRS